MDSGRSVDSAIVRDATGPETGAEGGAPSEAGSTTPDAGRSDVGVEDAGNGAAPNVFTTGSGLVEVFVNGASLGKTTAARALLSLRAAFTTGENEIVVRASNGGAAKPFVQLQMNGAFGKAGTSSRWKAKVAAGTEATDATGPWATLAFDDSGWALATDMNIAPVAPFPLDGPSHGIWTAAPADAFVLLRLKLYVPSGFDPAKPTGFASGVTGGLGGPTVTVTTPAELAKALGDNTPRVIQIAGAIDFIGTEGPTTASACYQSQCPDGTFEYIANGLGACTNANKPTFDVTYDKAGTVGLNVGSNKTIVGIGAGATIRGKGLRMINDVSNIIVRNLTMTNINPQIVWGGDAITIDGASNIWIDHVRVSLVGRQFLVSGFGPAKNVTLSWNEWDGRTSWSATCNGAHYWGFLIAGSDDSITVSNNWIHHTSGRAPHAGEFSKMQFANDLFETIPGHGAEPDPASSLLYEGTVFLDVTTPLADGGIYAPLASTVGSTSSACTTAIGRLCIANIATPQNGTFPLNANVLTTFSSRRAGLVTPYPAAEVIHAVPHLAGPGHI
jgi:pectate lyase